MNDLQKLKEAREFIESYLNRDHLTLNSQHSMGNYDDVFYDGKDKGYAEALVEILSIIKE